jgi:hypothetical protein
MGAIRVIRSIGCVVLGGLLGCGGPQETADTMVTDTAPPPRMEGKLRVSDQWVEVAPLVLHDGKMDLFVRCRIVQDDAKKAGQEVPLCYDPNKRGTDQIDTIRVEHWLNLPIAMRYLQVEAEGTHFLVERSGSTYQMLDLVYPARRAGAFARGEVRVVAADKAKGKTITDALKALYPRARVEEVDMTQVKPQHGPPPGKVPFAPGGPPMGPGHDHGHDHGDHDHDHGDHGGQAAPAPAPTPAPKEGTTP